MVTPSKLRKLLAVMREYDLCTFECEDFKLSLHPKQPEYDMPTDQEASDDYTDEIKGSRMMPLRAF